MRVPPEARIGAPPIPKELSWVNTAPLRLDQHRGRPVLVGFSDLLRPSSLRTAAYFEHWHSRYGTTDSGLLVVTVYAPWPEFASDPDVAARLAALAGLTHPVLLDLDLDLWRVYENPGWPTRYLFDREHMLFEHHAGEGGYAQTEAAIAELLDVPVSGSGPLHPIDAPDAELVVPTPDQEGLWSGEYEAGEAWAIVDGHGVLRVNGAELRIDGPGPVPLARHPEHTTARLELAAGDGVRCHAVCFSPGRAPAR